MDRAVVGWKLRSRHGDGALREQGRRGHRFWTARYGRSAIRIDADRPGLDRWGITLEGRSIRKGTGPGRDQAAAAVSGVLEERLA
jgi:hypothetical protein